MGAVLKAVLDRDVRARADNDTVTYNGADAVRGGAADRRAGHAFRPQGCDNVIQSAHAACPVICLSRSLQHKPTVKVTGRGHIENILNGAISAATGCEAFWASPMKPRFSYQC